MVKLKAFSAIISEVIDFVPYCAGFLNFMMVVQASTIMLKRLDDPE